MFAPLLDAIGKGGSRRGARRGAWIATAVLVCSGAGLVGAQAKAAGSTYGCQPGVLPGQAPAPKRAGQHLLFGITPDGFAGTIVPQGSWPAEDATKRLASLQQLAGGRPFVVHNYMVYSGVSTFDKPALHRMRALIADMRRHGLLSELVVRYAPADGGSPTSVAGYAAFIRHVVDVLGLDPSFIDLQVTNEVNQTLVPSSSDGAFSGARDALIQGVEAAKDESRGDGFNNLKIGFNWFYRLDPNTEDSFWTYLGTHGGARFARAVDWVGLDAYPGTWFPPVPADPADGMINALSVLRDCFMPAAGLGSKVEIHVAENGWPTGPGRPDFLQASALQQMVDTVSSFRGNYGVTDYRWYDLRDMNSSAPDFEAHWGLEYDNYAPKPSFGVYQSLIAALDTRTDPTRDPPVTQSPRCQDHNHAHPRGAGHCHKRGPSR